MNLSELRAKLRPRIGDPQALIAAATLDGHINDAIDYIIDRYRFQQNRALCSFDTVAGTYRYDLPSTYNHLLRVWDTTTKVRLTQRDDNWKAENQDVTTQGPPTSYVHYKDWIELLPVPDGVYSIQVRHKAHITALVEDSDEPSLPEAWHEGIVRYARYCYFDALNDVAKAAYALDAWDRWQESKPVEIDEELFHDNEDGIIVPSLSQRVPAREWTYED